MSRLDTRLRSLTDAQLCAVHLRFARLWLIAVLVFAACVVLGIWFDRRWFLTASVPLVAAVFLYGCVSEIGNECHRRRIDNL